MWDAPYDNETCFADQEGSTHNLHAKVIRCCGASSMAVTWRRPAGRVIESDAAGTAASVPGGDPRSGRSQVRTWASCAVGGQRRATENRRTAPLTPSTLAMIARALPPERRERLRRRGQWPASVTMLPASARIVVVNLALAHRRCRSRDSGAAARAPPSVRLIEAAMRESA